MNKLADEIRAYDNAELSRQIYETQHELFNLRFRLATRQLTDSTALPKTRKKLARLKTIQTEQRLAAEARSR